jgi:hypothetical protein
MLHVKNAGKQADPNSCYMKIPERPGILPKKIPEFRTSWIGPPYQLAGVLGTRSLNHASSAFCQCSPTQVIHVALEDGSAPYHVDWYDENDQDNPMNWSLPKRLVVLGPTTSVYIGSAILYVFFNLPSTGA